MKTIKAPNKLETPKNSTTIFLAGTIDMGNSENWQYKVEENFKDNSNVIFYNPRRDDWDSLWKQSINNPQFYEQVEWELTAMDRCDIILMNFLPDSQSPITLLELGLYAHSGKIVVCCPDKYWRSGNVHIICKRYGIPLYKNMDKLLQDLKIPNSNIEMTELYEKKLTDILNTISKHKN